MMNILKRGLSFTLALIMVIGLLPVTAFAAVDSTGRPKDVNNTLVLSIFTGEGFPGEPAVYGTSNYKNINSSFGVRSGATFANSANNQLDWNKINKDIVQGTSSGFTSVWGVYDANGTKDYFLSNASIIQPANEAKIIRAVKTELRNKSDAEVLEQYEIIWYVIKLQHSSGWRGATEWHIDGIIKERQYISINYYGNGNTSGNAPTGKTDHVAGEAYTVQGKNTMVKKINGVEVAFLGWSAKADGTGAEAGFYQPGQVINPTESISLYAMWDTTTQYTATVNTYLDGDLTSDSDIHGTDRQLALGTQDGTEMHYYDLKEDSDGVYSVKITGNGKFHLYAKNSDGTYTQIGTHQLTIYNQNGHLDVHHYSVNYDTNGGEFAAEIGNQAYFYGSAVSAVDALPVREGYRFLGWKDAAGNVIQPGEEVTASISAPITLTAQWEKTVNVTINVTVDHKGGDGYDQTEEKDDVSMALVSRPDSNTPYLEVAGKTLTLTDASHDGFEYSESNNVTRYTASGYTFTDLPGGDTEYTVVTSKPFYDVESVTATRQSDGNWVIDVKMVYRPTNFDLAFKVTVDENIPAEYVPAAAIVKVSFWSSDRNRWEIITQQEDGLPGVRVDIDKQSRSGSGSYPVWMNESENNPYGYRIVVTSFIYPDGTIVPAKEVVADAAWSDQAYTATMAEVVGGKSYGTGEGALKGAYYVPTQQVGELEAVITMDLHDVTFDAQGGKIKGAATFTVNDQYKIPAFKDYVPTRECGYIFDGWYEDTACTVPATEGKDLTGDVTLYAKWIEPLTVSGTVSISGTYKQGNDTVSVHEIDKATEAVVVLQEIRNGVAYEVDSKTVTFGAYSGEGSGEYSFTGLPNDGKNYQIHVLVLNYSTNYDNEGDADDRFTAKEYTAVFAGDNVADVDAHLEFVPPSYDQTLKVDATAIGSGFRPTSVLSEVMYRDTGVNHPYQRISQHDVDPYGVKITLKSGTGSGTQSIWKWHTDGTLYDYQMNITKVDGVDYDSDTAPFYITYAAPAYWDGTANAPSGELKATLIPNQYPVQYELNAGTDTVTGMEEYLDQASNTYQSIHTWSFETAITATPVREGYTFLGWQANAEGVYANGKIPASVHQDVVLTAQWEKNNYTVSTSADPAEGGTTAGDGSYPYGEQVTVTATVHNGFTFGGWYDGDTKVSDQAEYTFTVTGNRTLVARFTRNPYEVVANATTGGSASGTGTYEFGATATVTATAEDGYMFRGWYENGEKVSDETAYSFVVTENRTLTAQFALVYTITANAQTGGSASGGGNYAPNETATLTASANSNYYFVGWYDEKDELVTAETTFSLTVLTNRTFTAKFEQKVAYRCDYVYIFGYEDTTIGAEGPLLRSELAQMIYRLVKQKYPGTSAGSHVFSDTSGEWFQTGISYMTSKNAIDKTQQNANPYTQVTRGETYKMICLGLGFTSDATLSFSEYAAILRNSGYLSGDGAVTARIKRYEFCALFNAILGRTNFELIDTNGNPVTHETYGYTDLDPNASYYKTMLIATSTFTNGRVDLAKRAQRNPLDYGG